MGRTEGVLYLGLLRNSVPWGAVSCGDACALQTMSKYGEARMYTVEQDGVLWCHSLLCGRSLHCEVESVHCRAC